MEFSTLSLTSDCWMKRSLRYCFPHDSIVLFFFDQALLFRSHRGKCRRLWLGKFLNDFVETSESARDLHRFPPVRLICHAMHLPWASALTFLFVSSFVVETVSLPFSKCLSIVINSVPYWLLIFKIVLVPLCGSRNIVQVYCAASWFHILHHVPAALHCF